LPNHPIDIHVGVRLKQRRALLGMSQTALADMVGLTFQQIQKYERGSNRTGASRLYEFSKVLNVPISYFFDGMPSGIVAGRFRSKKEAPGDYARGINTKGETLQLVRAYYKISNTGVRQKIRNAMKALAAQK